MKEYKSYNNQEIDVLVNETWEVSDKPYKLHAAYALSCLYDICRDDDEEDEKQTPESMWGMSVPKNIVDRVVNDIAEDFNDAAKNYKPVKIWGKTYSIRKLNAYDPNRLCGIFKFKEEDGEYIISKDGVIDLSGDSSDADTYQKACDESRENRSYLRKIVMLAEDDEHDGWDKLTDMEIILYCWARFYNQKQMENLILFLEEYKDYLYVDVAEIESCLIDKASLRQRPIGMYTFSHKRVQEWNKRNKQRSYAAEIDCDRAEDYWYSVALKNSFKPIDF